MKGFKILMFYSGFFILKKKNQPASIPRNNSLKYLCIILIIKEIQIDKFVGKCTLH